MAAHRAALAHLKDLRILLSVEPPPGYHHHHHQQQQQQQVGKGGRRGRVRFVAMNGYFQAGLLVSWLIQQTNEKGKLESIFKATRLYIMDDHIRAVRLITPLSCWAVRLIDAHKPPFFMAW